MKKLNSVLGMGLMGLSLNLPAKSAQAAPIEVPTLVKGKNVYTVPEDFNPPHLGPEGIKKIELALQNFRYKYYVVLVEDLPISSAEQANRVMDQMIDGIADEWKIQNPQEFDNTASLFVQSFDPKKFRFLAGPKWRAELNFRKEAYEDYNKMFVKYAKGPTPDYATGIIEMGNAIDHYLIAQNLIQSPPVKLKPQPQPLHQPQPQRHLKDNKSHGEPSKPKAKKLPEAVEDKPNKERVDKEHLVMLQRMAILAPFLLAGGGILLRRRRFNKISNAFYEKLNAYSAKISHGLSNFRAFDQDREDVAFLTNLEGETKRVFDATTTEIDEIAQGLAAMERHIEACREMAKKGSWWLDHQSLEEADSALSRGIDFETGKINEIKLFHPRDVVVHYEPGVFFQTLDKRYELAMKGWISLKEARAKQNIDVRTTFSTESYNEMSQLLRKNGIPLSWLDKHPLAGDEASDDRLYERLTTLRDRDPLAYENRLRGLLEEEGQLKVKVEKLVKFLSEIIELEKTIWSIPQNSIPPEQENPEMTLNTANQKSIAFKNLLQDSTNFESTERAFEDANAYFSKAKGQIRTMEEAIHQSTETLRSVEGLFRQLATIKHELAGALKALANDYHEADLPSQRSIQEKEQEALRKNEQSKALLNEKRHVEANRLAKKTQEELKGVKVDYENLVRTCQGMKRVVTDLNNALDDTERVKGGVELVQNQAKTYLGHAAASHKGVTLPSLSQVDQHFNQAINHFYAAKLEKMNKSPKRASELIRLSMNEFGLARADYQRSIQRCGELDQLKAQLLMRHQDMPHQYQEALNKIRNYQGSQHLEAYSNIFLQGHSTYEAALNSLQGLADSWKNAVKRAKDEYEEQLERQRRREREAREAEARRVREVQEAEARRERMARLETERQSVVYTLIDYSSHQTDRGSFGDGGNDSDSSGGDYGGGGSDAGGGDY